jgi:pantoate--beta-alanine ligase
MKIITKLTDLNKAINKEKDLGFVPTMGSLHKGHKSLIKVSRKLTQKTLVSIFINPSQFNNKDDFESYPRNLTEDLELLKKLKVDIIYLPSINQIYKSKNFPKIILKKSQKILCAKFRKGHFEGVLDVLSRFIKLISPKMMFMGEKDYQQFFLVRDYISKKYGTIVYPCKTIRSSNGVAISSRNKLLRKKDLKTSGLIAHKLMKLKRSIYKKNGVDSINTKKSKKLIKETKNSLIKKYNIKVEYIELRNLINLNTNLYKKPFKLFVSYYLNNIRMIDNF